jgi:hypothetical protein
VLLSKSMVANSQNLINFLAGFKLFELQKDTIQSLQSVNAILEQYAHRTFAEEEVREFHSIPNDQSLGQKGIKKIDLVNNFKQLTSMAYAVSQNLLRVARNIFPRMKINANGSPSINYNN